jgi:hypothetical protein
MALAILGRHRTDSSNQLLKTTRQETIQLEILRVTHRSSPTFPDGLTELWS